MDVVILPVAFPGLVAATCILLPAVPKTIQPSIEAGSNGSVCIIIGMQANTYLYALLHT